jgi:hypothetical protein
MHTLSQAQHSPVGYRFVFLTVDTIRRLGKPFIGLLSKLGDLAVLRSDSLFTKGQFVSGVTHEFGLCWFNACLMHAVEGFFVCASSAALLHGLYQPTVDARDIG